MLAGFELDEHERTLLLQACRTADLLDSLETTVDAEGVMAESSQGIRVHPAVVELRQQRIAFARLLAALNVPSGEEGPAQSGGARGVYMIRGGRASA